MIGPLSHEIISLSPCPGIVTTHVHTLPLFLRVPVTSIDLEKVDSSDKIILAHCKAHGDVTIVAPLPPT